MTYKIGFASEAEEEKKVETTYTVPQLDGTPKRSVVQVYFSEADEKFVYYNDRFDLHIGDMVYVEGKMENELGCVISLNYNFKIKLSEYKRVIFLVDTSVQGQFFLSDSHFLTFDVAALPAEKAITWFMAPKKDDEEYVCGNDDTEFCLDNLQEMNLNAAIAERGHNYYLENRVCYLCINNNHGYAIVKGSEAYEVEFEYIDGNIKNLVCSCFCSYNCKHEFATMLQLKDILQIIEKEYALQYNKSGYFAAIEKNALFAFSIKDKVVGSITL